MDSKSKPHISVVSPVYRAETIVSELVKQLKDSLSTITSDFEIILVNDSSPDNSWGKILEESKMDERIKGINLSRNFGQHYAISAGLDNASGDWVVVMDCDLQDRPDQIPNLYAEAQKGFDIVYARRIGRTDGFTKRMTSKFFYKVYNYLSGMDFDGGIANFGLYSKQVISEFCKMREGSRSFPSLVQRLGFHSTFIDVQHSERYEGKSSYTYFKLFKLAGDVIISNSNKPLRLIIRLGVFVSILSFLIAAYNVISYFMGVIKVPGFTTTVFSIWFVGGLILITLGVIGLYIGKIYDEVKNRQLYIIKDKVNF